MAMTECPNRDTAVRVLQMANWDEITAANNYFAENSHPPPQMPRGADPQRAERLIDDFEFFDQPRLWDQQEKDDDAGIFAGIGTFIINGFHRYIEAN